MPEKAKRLSFRKLTADDLSFMLTLTGAPGVVRYLPGMITDESMMRQWISALRADENEYLISLSDTDEPIGECSLTPNADSFSCDIGYMLLPKYWDQGFGTETACWLLNTAKALGFQRITATTHSQNGASIRILNKLGFQKSAIGWMLIGTPTDLRDNQLDVYMFETKEEQIND